MEKGNLIGCVYSKAFDTIGTVYCYANRTHLVESQNTCSRPYSITSGVPQGSILGPLIFIVFFNDLKESIDKSEVITYADDRVIFYAYKEV